MAYSIKTIKKLVSQFGDKRLMEDLSGFLKKSNDLDVVQLERECISRLVSDSDMAVFAYLSNVINAKLKRK